MRDRNMNSATTLKLAPALLFLLSPFAGYSQATPADTVVVPLAATSKIVFTIQDRRDLDVLRHYNFQKLFDDILQKIAAGDSTLDTRQEQKEEDWSARAENHQEVDKEDNDRDKDDDDIDDGDQQKWDNSRRGRIGQTWQSYNVDLGTNNYLAGGQFPDGSEPYAVRPWGSWYLGVNSVQRTRLGKNVFVEWGLGVSWYSFKFQEDNTLVLKDGPTLQFASDTRDVDYVKSKLGATFVNASLVPVLDFRDHGRKGRVWQHDRGGFRFGAGPYVGYRISSKTKLVYETGGDRKREKDHDSYYLNNLRYGLRMQIGVRSTDLFINYDINELFATGKGPGLNAISFGLIF